MDAEAVELGRELRQVLQALLAAAPVVPVLPVGAEITQPVDGYALAPIGHGRRLGPTGVGEAPAKVVELVVADTRAERGHGVSHGRTLGTRRLMARQHPPAGADVEEAPDVPTDDLGAGRGVVHALVHVVHAAESELGDAVDLGAPGVRLSTTMFW